MVGAHRRMSRADVEVVGLCRRRHVPPHPFLLPRLAVAPVEHRRAVDPEADGSQTGCSMCVSLDRVHREPCVPVLTGRTGGARRPVAVAGPGNVGAAGAAVADVLAEGDLVLKLEDRRAADKVVCLPGPVTQEVDVVLADRGLVTWNATGLHVHICDTFNLGQLGRLDVGEKPRTVRDDSGRRVVDVEHPRGEQGRLGGEVNKWLRDAGRGGWRWWPLGGEFFGRRRRGACRGGCCGDGGRG